jgi:hypothetical protein
MATQQQTEGQGAGFEASELQTLLNKEFKPRSDAAKEAVETAVRTLAEQALASTAVISSDTIGTIEAMIAALDRKLSEQVNLIMHHKAFQEVESAWRGLNYLVTNTETDEMLKIRVMNISKADLGRTLKRYKGVAWDQSPIFKKLYEAEYGQFGGEPFGCLVGDYYFDHTPPDVELVGQMAQVAAAAHCPFIAGVSPSVMQMESWQELANPRDLTKIFTTPEYAPWRSLRESEDSRYVGLAMPRFLGRYPYGKANPVEEFDFQEDTEGARHDKFAWVNSAYAMGVNITRSFKLYGWCSRIRGVESGGSLEGLPVHTFPTDDGGVDGHRGVHRGAVAPEAVRVHRRGCHRQRQPLGAAAVPLRGLPVRALSEMHRARQDRLLQGAQRDGGVAQQVDLELRPQQPGVGGRGDQGQVPAVGGRGHGRRSRRQSRVLHVEVLSAAPLSAGGLDGIAAARVQAAVGQGWEIARHRNEQPLGATGASFTITR